MLISITRLRLTSWFRIFKFFGLSTPAIDQAIQDRNCLAGATYSGPGPTFWTATVWTDEESMRNYVMTGAHQLTMPWLARICSEGATTHYKSKKSELPERHEIVGKLVQSPRFFRVEKPTAAHKSKTIPNVSPKLMRRFK